MADDLHGVRSSAGSGLRRAVHAHRKNASDALTFASGSRLSALGLRTGEVQSCNVIVVRQKMLKLSIDVHPVPAGEIVEPECQGNGAKSATIGS
jgi:hypothetical protein